MAKNKNLLNEFTNAFIALYNTTKNNAVTSFSNMSKEDILTTIEIFKEQAKQSFYYD